MKYLLRVSQFTRINKLGVRYVTEAAINRNSRFKSLSAIDVNKFKEIVGETGLITDKDDLEAFNTDWMGKFRGAASLVLKPKSTEQVSQIMKYCHDNYIAVVPQGGNTGLVGGSVPLFDEVILSLNGMNAIESFDKDSGVIVTQAGVVLEALDNHVGESGYRVPLDLGAKGSCQIGGNVATNAGGSRFIRYGSLRGSVLGLEAVLPDGRVLDTLTTLRKDNTGYDLKQLMIGGEGTLGVITRVAIACPMRSVSVDTVVVRVDDFSAVSPLLRVAKQKLGEVLSAFEYMDNESVSLATKELSHVSNPLSDPETLGEGCGLVLIECAGSDTEHNRQKLENFLEAAFEEEIISDGVIAENETQSTALWELRESLPEATLKASTGGTLKYDVSLPLSAFHEILKLARERVKDLEGVEVVGWGHIGDQNLHLNVAVREKEVMNTAKDRLEPWVFEFVSQNRGSVSAEHGLGLMKRDAIWYSKTSTAVDVMKTIKAALDERGICNPYKMLPSDEK